VSQGLLAQEMEYKPSLKAVCFFSQSRTDTVEGVLAKSKPQPCYQKGPSDLEFYRLSQGQLYLCQIRGKISPSCLDRSLRCLPSFHSKKAASC